MLNHSGALYKCRNIGLAHKNIALLWIYFDLQKNQLLKRKKIVWKKEKKCEGKRSVMKTHACVRDCNGYFFEKQKSLSEKPAPAWFTGRETPKKISGT
jgi:hypothetical protein